MATHDFPRIQVAAAVTIAAISVTQGLVMVCWWELSSARRRDRGTRPLLSVRHSYVLIPSYRQNAVRSLHVRMPRSRSR